MFKIRFLSLTILLILFFKLSLSDSYFDSDEAKEKFRQAQEDVDNQIKKRQEDSQKNIDEFYKELEAMEEKTRQIQKINREREEIKRIEKIQQQQQEAERLKAEAEYKKSDAYKKNQQDEKRKYKRQAKISEKCAKRIKDYKNERAADEAFHSCLQLEGYYD